MQQKIDHEIAQYHSRTITSKSLQDRASYYLPGGSTRDAQYFDPYPIFADHGKGHYLFDVDNNKYLDFVINATSLILGHSHPEIITSLQKQVELGTAFSAPIEKLIDYSELLLGSSWYWHLNPGWSVDFPGSAFFLNLYYRLHPE